jgi:hypothetical protein
MNEGTERLSILTFRWLIIKGGDSIFTEENGTPRYITESKA